MFSRAICQPHTMISRFPGLILEIFWLGRFACQVHIWGHLAFYVWLNLELSVFVPQKLNLWWQWQTNVSHEIHLERESWPGQAAGFVWFSTKSPFSFGVDVYDVNTQIMFTNINTVSAQINTLSNQTRRNSLTFCVNESFSIMQFFTHRPGSLWIFPEQVLSWPADKYWPNSEFGKPLPSHLTHLTTRRHDWYFDNTSVEVSAFLSRIFGETFWSKERQMSSIRSQEEMSNSGGQNYCQKLWWSPVDHVWETQ